MKRLKNSNILPLIVTAIGGIGCSSASADTINLGSDYFQTDPGTNFTFGAPIGVVNFTGVPIGPGQTDTIVQRQADATINPGVAPTGLTTVAQVAALPNSIPLQITALSMESTAPVNIGGSFFDVFVTLDPSNLANDTGSMAIYGDSTGGSFDSAFTVYFEAQFDDLSNPAGSFDAFNHVVLSQNGATWAPTPSPGTVVVSGPAGDQNANQHTTGANTDFYLRGILVEDSSGEAHHFVSAASAVPEPASLWLMGAGLGGLLFGIRKFRRA